MPFFSHSFSFPRPSFHTPSSRALSQRTFDLSSGHASPCQPSHTSPWLVPGLGIQAAPGPTSQVVRLGCCHCHGLDSIPDEGSSLSVPSLKPWEKHLPRRGSCLSCNPPGGGTVLDFARRGNGAEQLRKRQRKRITLNILAGEKRPKKPTAVPFNFEKSN